MFVVHKSVEGAITSTKFQNLYSSHFMKKVVLEDYDGFSFSVAKNPLGPNFVLKLSTRRRKAAQGQEHKRKRRKGVGCLVWRRVNIRKCRTWKGYVVDCVGSRQTSCARRCEAVSSPSSSNKVTYNLCVNTCFPEWAIPRGFLTPWRHLVVS